MRDKSHRSHREPRPSGRGGHQSVWIYGRHPVLAALTNPERRIERVLATKDVAERTPELPAAKLQIVTREDLAQRLPKDAVHQGLAMLAAPLEEAGIEDLLARCSETAMVLALDQVTDPHNVGAILRTAAAFGAAGVLTTERNAPADTGVLAKAASGALELVPLVRAVNLARALDQLKEAGFWLFGLDERGDTPLTKVDLSGRACIVLGAEGEGLRRLTAEKCDRLVTIPTKSALAALNVSNAAAVAAYEWARLKP